MAKKESTSTSKLKPVHTDKEARVPGQCSLQIPRGLGNKEGDSLPCIADRFTDDEVKDVIHKCYGIRTSMCAMLDCTYNQLVAWLRTHEWAKDEMVKAREGIVNLAEDVIIKALRSDDEKIRLEAAKTTLRQLGRNYGWGEAGNPVMVNVMQDAESKKVQVQAIFGLGDGNG